MTNAIYPTALAAMLQGDCDLDGDVRAILVDLADYTYSAAHDFLDDVPSGARVAVTGSLGSKTFGVVAAGVFDCANSSWSAVTGDQSEAVIFYLHTGTEGTSRLLAYFDTGITGIPVTPSGGDINLNIHASGVFAI